MPGWFNYRIIFLCSVFLNCVLILQLTKDHLSEDSSNPSALSVIMDSNFNCRMPLNGKAQQSIFLLKTHKTASSAIQNILLRRTLVYGLSIGLTKASYDWNRFCPKYSFSRQCICNSDELPFSVIAHHMIFNETEVRASLAKDAKFVTILRDPVSVISSGYTYFNWGKHHTFKSFEDFVNQSVGSQEIDSLEVPFRNIMMYDLGLKPSEFDNDDSIDSKITGIQSSFDLIMIKDGEYFNQSLILLKNLMGWSTEDIAVLAVNKRVDSSTQAVVTEELKSKILQANRADYLLYQRFLSIFKEKLKEFGAARMKEELEILDFTTEQLTSFCIAGSKRGSRNTVAYILTKAGEKNCYCS